MSTATHRVKVSTTIRQEARDYLECLIQTGRAATLAEAIDQVVETAQMADSRERLERDTAAYFESLSPREAEEESRLGSQLAQSLGGVNFDQ